MTSENLDWAFAGEITESSADTDDWTKPPVQSKLLSFLKTKKCLINKNMNTDALPSHVFMDQGRTTNAFAGKMRIELGDLKGFREACATDYGNDTMHPVVERFPEVYRFAVDFDLKTQQELNKDDKISFARTAQKSLRDFLATASSECHKSIVCLVEGEVRICGDEDNKLFKDGIHQHWPHLHVNHAQAQHLLTHVILPAMETAHKDAGINWTETLDASIYHDGKGLRPCYSVKREVCKCTSYKEKALKNCKDCMGTKMKHATDHYYVPTIALAEDGTKDEKLSAELVDDIMCALECTSVIPATEQTAPSCQFECRAPAEKRKRATKASKHVTATRQRTASRQMLTFDEVQKIYHEAGGTLELQEMENTIEGCAGYREISPGHDERPCLCPDCNGAMHSDNAILTDTAAGLLYTCLSTKNRHYLTEIETDLDLCLGGDLGLAKLVAKLLKDDLFNAAGDNKDAEFYFYDKKTCLWAVSFASTIKAAAIPQAKVVVQRYMNELELQIEALDQDIAEKKEKIEAKKGDIALLKQDVDKLAKRKEAVSKQYSSLAFVNTSLNSNGCLSAILSLLQHEVRNLTFKEKLDKQLDIVSITAGIVELRTGVLRTRTKEDYCSFAIDIVYDPEHPSLPKIKDIMTQITLAERLKRPEYLDFMQRLLGYHITGETFKEICSFAIGCGANGKSFVKHLFEQSFGTYYLVASVYVMAKATNGDSASGTSSHLMALEGKRIAIIEELKDVTLDIDQVKRMTGGGKLTGRELFKKQTSFLMTCKLMALLNQMPKLDADAAVKRRVFTLPFNAKFYPVANADKKLQYDKDDPTHFVRDDTLKGDETLPSAFFAWCVEGAVKFYRDGLGPTPACCDTLKLEFEASNDKVSSWIVNSCNTDDSDGLYPAADAFHAYSSTMLKSGFKPLGKQEFYRDMQQREYRKDKYQGPLHEFKNKHCFFGIKAD